MTLMYWIYLILAAAAIEDIYRIRRAWQRYSYALVGFYDALRMPGFGQQERQ